MKICMIFSNYPPNYKPGGIADYTRILVEKLRRSGFNVSVIASERYAGNDPKVFKVGSINWGLSELLEISKIAKREKFDILHMQYTPESYGFGISFKFLPLVLKIMSPKTRFITTFHTLVGGRWISKVNAFLLSLFSERVISTNEELTYLFLRRLPLFRKKLKQVEIGSNIIPARICREETKTEIRMRFSIKKDAVILSTFGFPNPGKGLEDLLEALSILNRDEIYYLFLIGSLRDEDKNYRKKLNTLIQKLSLEKKVFMVENSSPESVSQFLFASDIYVVPYRDGICTRRGSLMAGIVHHLPIISTYPRVQSPYFRHNENVVLVKANSPKELAKAIKMLSSNNILKEKLIRNIIDTKKHFNWDDIAYRTMRVYGESSRKLSEKIRYVLKIIIESMEYLFWNHVVMGKKKEINQHVNFREIKPAKILNIQINSIGDVLMTTPALRTLRENFPKAQIDILTLPHTAEILKDNPDVDNIYSCNADFWRFFPLNVRKLSENIQTINNLKNSNYDLCLSYGGTFGFVLLAGLVKASLSVGPLRELKRGIFQENTSLFYSATVSTTEKHIIEDHLKLVEYLGCKTKDKNEQFFINPEDEKAGDEFLQKHALSEKNYAVMHPGAKWSPKRWPAHCFSALIDILFSEKNIQTILVGAYADSKLLEEIRQKTESKTVIICSNLNLKNIGYIIRKSLFFVGNDSGIAHVAGSVNVPCIVLFGPTDPDTCLPRSDKVLAVRENMPCWPCILYYRRDNCEIGENVCMQKLTPMCVMKEIEKLTG
ncbi:glycosyltransferase [bacterium]|nr:glycosyltransferase [bacterium]